MSSQGTDDFGRFLKPDLQRRLEALGMAVVYHRGRGDYLYFREGEEEVEVLDMVGGFGANLLGHNHPDVVAAYHGILNQERPFLAQGSIRAEAGRLARRLSELAGKSTGRSYVVTLANSGAEAVDAALKHAELERRSRLSAHLTRMRRTFAELERRLAAGSAELREDFLEDAASAAGEPPFEDLEDLFDHLEGRIRRLMASRPVTLALEGAFHGKTVGASQLTHNPVFRDRWGHLGPRVLFLRPEATGELESVLERERQSFWDLEISRDGRVALVPRHYVDILACFAEPIQGEGGVRPLSTEFLQALRAAADTAGFPLVFDEIQSGMGRTGTFLASAATGVRADYYTLAKSLGGGLAKVSALLVDREHHVEEFDRVHTSTYADDDPASAAANATLDWVERNGGQLMTDCREKGEYLISRLRDLKDAYPGQVQAVRGRGLLIGVELASQEDSSSRLLRVLSKQDRLGEFVCGHLLSEARIRVLPTLSAPATLRLEPSAFIERAEMDRFCHALEGVLVALRDADTQKLARYLAPGAPTSTRAPAADQTTASVRPDSPGAATDGQVAFLGHFLEPGDLRDWDPTLSGFSDEACERFLRRTRGGIDPFVADQTVIRSVTGVSVTATLIALPFTTAQAEEATRAGEDQWLLEWIDQAMDLARELGCTVVGFGGYTSVATHACRSIYAPGLAVTTGNALTTAAALEATMRAAGDLGIESRRLGVVGAMGNIGRILAELAAPRVDEVVLIGRAGTAARLRSVAQGLSTRTRVGTSMDDLRECNIVISATNSTRPVVGPEHVKADGPVVLSDIALPGDVDPRVREERPSAVLLRGGIIRAPLDQDLELVGVGLRPGEVYGCLAETALLGFEGIRESFSRGPIRAELVRRARELAEKHGFSIDEPVVS